MARFDLSDEEWATIEPLLPVQGHGAKLGDDRKQPAINSTDLEEQIATFLDTIAIPDSIAEWLASAVAG